MNQTTDNQSQTEQQLALQKRKNRQLLFGVFLCFVIPLGAAKLIYDMQWFTPGVTNKGTLIDPPIELSAEENAQLPDTWRLAYRVPNDCDQLCVNGLYVINQTDIAIGREGHRVTPVGITATDQVSNLPELSSDSAMRYVQLPEAHQALAELPEGSLLIIDPLGFVIMRYDGGTERTEVIRRGGDILDDMKKLLKMSRVG